LNIISNEIFSEKPKTFEQIDLPYGYLVYQTIIEKPQNSTLIINQVHDRAVVMLNNVTQNILYRPQSNNFTLNVNLPNSTLQILFENMGRVNFGKK
jgi:beta-galactosidase